MRTREAEMIVQENAELISKIVKALSESQARLPRKERLQLNARIIGTITNAVTTAEVNKELVETSATANNNLKQLFNGLIEYYTEMASYGYERAPDILAKFGSVIAGSAIIGSTIVASSPIQPTDNLLIFLASYLQTAITTASGLYFLQRGGLPIKQILASQDKILNTDQSIYADGAQGTDVSGTDYGWAFKNPNNNGSKINWYYYSKSNSDKSIKVKDLTNMYCVITESVTNLENPFFILYTTLTGSGDAASWYHSKLFYGSNNLPQGVDKSKPILLYTGTNDPNVHPEIESSNRQQLQLNSSLCNPTTINSDYTSSSEDEINLISLQTSSQAVSYNKYDF